MVNQIRAAGEIDNGASQGLIQRHVGVAEARDPAPVAERFMQGLAQHPACVLDSVMAVNLEIALGRDGQIHMAVARKLSQHVVEERNAGVDLVLACAVEVQGHTDFGFPGLSRLRGDSCVRHRFSIV